MNPELAETPVVDHGYQSDVSEVSQFAEENDVVSNLFVRENASPRLGEPDVTKKPEDVTLFKVKGVKPSFLKRRSFAAKRDSPNVFTNGLNKLTFGGLDKVTNSIDKIKEYVNDTPKRRRRKERDTSKADYDSDLDFSDSPGIPSGNLVTPTLQVEETTGEITTLSHTAAYLPNLPYDPEVSPPPEAKKETVKFAATKFDHEVAPLPKETIDIRESITLFIRKIWKLHRETINGPRKLGPINTAMYERSRLEENFVELFSEIFELNYRHNWIYTQLHFFIKPLIVGFGGHIINR